MELLSLARMANRIGVTQQWLREAAEAGRIPFLKAGSRYLFEPTAVIDAVATMAAKLPKGGRDDR